MTNKHLIEFLGDSCREYRLPPLRYNKLGYVALEVTDRERSVAFHREAIGLELLPAVDAQLGAALLRSRNSHCDLALYQASTPGVRRVAFEMENQAQLDLARGHLRGLGLELRATPAADRRAFAQTDALRFTEPVSGLTVELYVADGAPPPPLLDEPITNITALGHAVVYVTDAPKVVKFFMDELNFRASDFVGEAAFLRCFPNPNHHSFAVVPWADNHLNHVNFLVDHIDDVGRALYRLQAQAVPIVFGPGRHPPSGSVFLYFTDPDGFTFELSTGMEAFPERDPRPPRDLPRVRESLDYWGSNRTEDYGRVGRFTGGE
jgi:2,3-dihydroxy-p-cumate/2,3-dihydroxybenzoate 3,4-dioxygenase